jgi:hypothetical protein
VLSRSDHGSPHAVPRVGDRRDGHSDNGKFCNDLNRQKGCELSESALKQQRKFEDFQAEYEGSIPSTRSKFFNDLARGSDFIPTNGAALGMSLAEGGLFADAPVWEPH